ncbi:Uma2 family endonuclease [Siccirubricoccus sp. G192]|nr:Uma2 family endonuclease [Siccirubricoccus sp. G192]
MSPGTRAVDSGIKLTDYFRVPSIRHYLILLAEQRRVIHHWRREDGSLETRLIGAGPVGLDPPGITIMAEALFGA